MNTRHLKLGKKPPRPEAIKFKLRDFVDFSQLPKPPKNFGHEAVIDKKSWGVLGNDNYGDCVLAGGAHETMMWNKIAGKDVLFTDKNVLSDYSAITGFDPTDPNSDQGTDMKEAASYRRKTGMIDSNGIRHKVAAYLSIDAGNLREHYVALYLFGAVGIGIQFPSSAFDQINKGKVWSVVKGASIEGGHYLPLVAKRSHLQCVTWGAIQGLTTGFFSKYNDESICYCSLEMLLNNKSPEGFDSAKLLECLNQLK